MLTRLDPGLWEPRIKTPVDWAFVPFGRVCLFGYTFWLVFAGKPKGQPLHFLPGASASLIVCLGHLRQTTAASDA